MIRDYPNVARIGGAVWIGLLSLIVAMPLVTAHVKKVVAQRSLQFTEEN